MTKRPPTKAEREADYLWWLVFTPVHVAAVFAENADAARTNCLRSLNLLAKPWLGRDWNIRLAKPEELDRHLRQTTSKGKQSIKEAVTLQAERLAKRPGAML